MNGKNLSTAMFICGLGGKRDILNLPQFNGYFKKDAKRDARKK